jgi:hypothetical protein
MVNWVGYYHIFLVKLAAFDLEIAKVLPDWEQELKRHRPLGISCAAVRLDDGREVIFHSTPETIAINTEGCREIVTALNRLVKEGYTIVTWNGAGFDFDILAEESADYTACVELARQHVDLMLIVVALRGHFLGLDAAATGMRVPGKLKQVMLRDGRVLDGMTGAMAPRLWQEGEREAVLAYLSEDVRVTLELAQAIAAQRRLFWRSKRGGENQFTVPKQYSVAECLRLPRPKLTLKGGGVDLHKVTAWLL